MKSKYLGHQEKYDGSQLVSLRNYLEHGLLGDSIVAWVGACDVSFAHMVDGEDLLQNARIAGDSMLHFIVEKFAVSLFAAVGLQRLLAGIVKDQVQSACRNRALAQTMVRLGDDLYCDTRKLSISIATQSPVSSLIHFAVNITNEGTPVPTLSLHDLGMDEKELALLVMQVFCAEVTSMLEATCKVRWVK